MPSVENMGCASDADTRVDRGVGDAAGDGGQRRTSGVDPGRRSRRGDEDRAVGGELCRRGRAVVWESAGGGSGDGFADGVFVSDVGEYRGVCFVFVLSLSVCLFCLSGS